MNCPFCNKELLDPFSFCPHCGAFLENQDLNNTISPYPKVIEYYHQSKKHVTNKDYESAANTMRKTIEAMVAYILSIYSLKFDQNLQSNIECLFRNHIISESSYRSYNTIRDFGNLFSHATIQTPTEQETQKMLLLLSKEMKVFIEMYSIKNPHITELKPLKIQFDYFDLASRIFGIILCVFSVGLFISFPKDLSGGSWMLYIIALIFMTLGVLSVLKGKKFLKAWNRFRMMK